MTQPFPEILRHTTGTSAIDFLQAVQVAAHKLQPDYAEQTKMMSLGLEQSEVYQHLGHPFLSMSTSFIPNAPEVLSLQDGVTKQYAWPVRFSGRLASIGDYWNFATKSRVFVAEFNDIELIDSLRVPEDIGDMVESAIFLETIRRGSVDVPCMALKSCISAEWDDAISLG